ncbi:hypothetical protein COLO4_32121 [Corchorus olitorius]|uniref:Uncharacterized protein n=1 Tax=Corchorus olitorius TaxID=93759 RepID=A0A1R3H136_9ROSI|nr:hypothetical protein COLO4_32121 [Corchorus olitorius]
MGMRSAGWARKIGVRLGDLVEIDDTLDEGGWAIFLQYEPWREVVGSATFHQLGKSIGITDKAVGSSGSTKVTNRALFIKPKASAVAGRKNVQLPVAKKPITNDGNREICGEINGSDNGVYQGNRVSKDLVVTNPQILRGMEGILINQNPVGFESKRVEVGCMDLGQGMLDKKDVGSMAKDAIGHRSQGHNKSLDHGEKSVGCFNFQATRTAADVEVSSVSRHFGSHAHNTGRKKLLPIRVGMGGNSKSSSAFSLGKRIGQGGDDTFVEDIDENGRSLRSISSLKHVCV